MTKCITTVEKYAQLNELGEMSYAKLVCSGSIPEEIFEIAKLLAKISVDEYLKGKLQ